MLHEVLLALSGHPSPLFSEDETLLASPSEKALLQSIGRLSELHRKLRQHIAQTAQSHESPICRAVATSMQQRHLSRFQQKILDVESKILTKDASLVGAYDIVPLAGVVGEFDDWRRRMAWYWDLACFMQRPEAKSHRTITTGAALIDKLRAEQQTGYSDIEMAALELTRTAEVAWLRQLAAWLLYGQLPTFGSSDFFIQANKAEDSETMHFSKDKALLPNFVTTTTASSMLFIGKSLHQSRTYGQQLQASKSRPSGLTGDFVSVNMQRLSALSLPVVPAELSRTIAAVRLSLSRTVLQHLLPMDLTLQMLSCLKQFFLLTRSEFAVTLINESDARMQYRQQAVSRLIQQDPVKALQGLSIKDAETHQTLSLTWKALASRDEDAEDEILDFARNHVSLSTASDSSSRPSTSDSLYGAAPKLTPIAFNDLLFPNAVALDLTIAPPLDLFVSPHDVDTYSAINAFLLTIKRAHLRLSDLWRRTSARRDHQASGKPQDAMRIGRRSVAARKVWATCSAAVFLLSETSAYFEGEIIRESWNCFEDWVRRPAVTDEVIANDTTDQSEAPYDIAQRDPETLASAHRAFLASLTYALLLTDVPYTKELRSLLGNIDHLVAYFNRSLDLQQKLDAEHDAGGESGYTAEEEHRMSLELDRARKKVDSDLKSVVNRLRQLDHERIGSARYFNIGPTEGGFEMWKGGGVDRLLMKLDFGRMTEDELEVP